jgi:hypothetical protein
LRFGFEPATPESHKPVMIMMMCFDMQSAAVAAAAIKIC